MISATHKEKAYAKINLYLDVIKKRDDGYHDVVSIMQNISLHDVVSISAADANETKISVACDDAHIPQGSKNIAYKAAELFLDRLGKKAIVSINIEKNIPSAAGLAGGSADAAAVLRALNVIFEKPFSDGELCDLAAKIGADVPFCVLEGTYIAKGIGEVLEECAGLDTEKVLLIARGGEEVSTPVAYKALDALYGEFEDKNGNESKLEELLNAIKEKNDEAAYFGMYNVFEDVVLPNHSMAQKIKETMYESGAEFAMMSGSGPSVFGIFPDEVFALNALFNLKALGVAAHVCNPL